MSSLKRRSNDISPARGASSIKPSLSQSVGETMRTVSAGAEAAAAIAALMAPRVTAAVPPMATISMCSLLPAASSCGVAAR